MRSPILASSTRFILPLILLVSVFLLVRGHHEPGGGFVGGLVAAAGFVLVSISHGADAALRLMVVRPATLIATGLMIALASGAIALAHGTPFLTGLWVPGDVPLVGGIGTPMIFDTGVYCVVLGFVMLLVTTLAEQ